MILLTSIYLLSTFTMGPLIIIDITDLKGSIHFQWSLSIVRLHSIKSHINLAVDSKSVRYSNTTISATYTRWRGDWLTIYLPWYQPWVQRMHPTRSASSKPPHSCILPKWRTWSLKIAWLTTDHKDIRQVPTSFSHKAPCGSVLNTIWFCIRIGILLDVG